jgi:hypothetical protein
MLEEPSHLTSPKGKVKRPKWQKKSKKKKFFLFCVRRESNPGPIEAANTFVWQRWILPLNHKRLKAETPLLKAETS